MLDQVKSSDPRLKWVSLLVLTGMAVLAIGVWYLQVVTRNKYEASLKVQSFRNVRLPAVRGKILDQKGKALAENQPMFAVNLYLEDLRSQFTYTYTN
ncbi:MAG: hypothetical protein ACO1QB_19285, partial [Verrucomicrobiales bacterium]